MNIKRISYKPRINLILFLLFVTICCTGCQAFLFTLLVLFKGTETPAEFKFMKGKKVAVICRADKMSNYIYDDVPQDLARRVGNKLNEQVKKIEVISPEKVKKCLSRHGEEIEDFEEFGRELGAQMVLCIEIGSFETQSKASQGSCQGHANLSFNVYDIENNANVIASKTLPEIVFPPGSRISLADKTEREFRVMFLDHLSDHIGCYFYPFDRRNFVALDAKAGL